MDSKHGSEFAERDEKPRKLTITSVISHWVWSRDIYVSKIRVIFFQEFAARSAHCFQNVRRF